MARFTLPGEYHIAVSEQVQAPAAKVWEVIADFSAVDTWAPQVTRSYALAGSDHGVGARRHCDIKGFGGIDEVVTQWNEGRSLTYEVTPLGPLGVSHNRWSVTADGDSRSNVTFELGYDIRFGVLGRLLHGLMMRRKLEAAFPQGLAALKARVESGRLVRPRRAPSDAPQLAAGPA